MGASPTISASPTADLPARIHRLAEGFEAGDWSSCTDFLSIPRIASLREECETLMAAGCFRAAGVGHGAERVSEVRGDAVLWLEEQVAWAPEASRLLREELAALREAMNAATYLGLHEFEGHYAVYPSGAGYARHLDRFREDNRRVVSLVLYLNDAWGAEEGGELCLYADERALHPVARFAPQAGTLVCFLSERVPHEVLAARRTRLSLTGWFRRRA